MDQNKTAYITGASSGIGRAFAFKCAALGYDLVIIARNENTLRKLADELSREFQVRCRIIVADLAVKENVDKIVEVISKDNSIQMIINNAGFAVPEKFAECNIDRQLDMVRVHVMATTKLTRAALPIMMKNRYGYIVNVASTLAFASFPHNAIYCATKAYINSFTKTLYHEYRGAGIIFQALNPGLTKTNFHNTDAFKHIPQDSSRDWMTMSPQAVVDYSFQKMGKHLIAVPGFINRFSITFEGLFTKILCQKHQVK